MAITIPITGSDKDASISLDEFVHDVQGTLDPQDPSTLLALAPRLRRLANNRKFLADFISEEMLCWEDFQRDTLYTSQVFQLAVGDSFIVRANVWEPPRIDDKSPGQRDGLFMYQDAHDHNFSFLTVGYFGAGYQTTIYECDPDSVTGVPGTRVDMTFSETTTLPEGKVMMYRAGQDIHRQEYPTEYSLSLNLLVLGPQQASREQHYFDLERRTILTSMKALPGHPRMNCYLARFVANDSTRCHLDVIRRNNPSPLVRLTATESLAWLCPGDSGRLWQSALRDDDQLVREGAYLALTQLDRGAPVDLRSLTNT
jgi:hypothetical protein